MTPIQSKQFRSARLTSVKKKNITIQDKLPAAVLQIAYSFLNAKDLASASLACRFFYTNVMDKRLWVRLLHGEHLSKEFTGTEFSEALRNKFIAYMTGRVAFKNGIKGEFCTDFDIYTEGPIISFIPFCGRYLSVHRLGTVKFWSLKKNENPLKVLDVQGSLQKHGVIMSGKVLLDRYLCLLREKKRIQIWDLGATKEPLAKLKVACDSVCTFDALGSRIVYSASKNGIHRVDIWDWKLKAVSRITETQSPASFLTLEQDSVKGVQPNDMLVTWSLSTKAMTMINIPGLSQAKKIDGDLGRLFIITAQDRFHVWDYSSRKRVIDIPDVLTFSFRGNVAFLFKKGETLTYIDLSTNFTKDYQPGMTRASASYRHEALAIDYNNMTLGHLRQYAPGSLAPNYFDTDLMAYNFKCI